MARPRQQSTIQIPPRVKGFIPIGFYGDESEPVQLNMEEFEAIRLLDYEHLSQIEASGYMNISRPTLTRIYDRARKKIAEALTESHQLLIEGGTGIFEGYWYACNHCNSRFNSPRGFALNTCVLCDNTDVHQIEIS